MGFIGVQPAIIPLTASDITDGIISNAKLGADAVNAAKISDDSISDEHLDITAITGHSEKTSLVDADKFLISDSAASGALKYVQNSNLGGGGKILQMQNMTTASQTETTSTTFADTAITDSITPSATTSKILILITDSCQITMSSENNDQGMAFRLKRSVGGSDTNVYSDNQPYEGFYHAQHTGSNPNYRMHLTFTAIDSPNTTSACTYTHQIAVYRSGTHGKARSVHDNNRGNMILMEIGA